MNERQRARTAAGVHVEAANAASDVWEPKVRRLQELVRLANRQLEGSFAPLSEFAVVAENADLLEELNEALDGVKAPEPSFSSAVWGCPDSGKCHHACRSWCFRVVNAGPLSGEYPDDKWPAEVVAYHMHARATHEG